MVLLLLLAGVAFLAGAGVAFGAVVTREVEVLTLEPVDLDGLAVGASVFR